MSGFSFFSAAAAAPEFSRGFQPTGRLENISSSRQRRLNSIVADATGNENHAHRGLKPTAKFRRRYAAGEACDSCSKKFGHIARRNLSALLAKIYAHHSWRSDTIGSTFVARRA